MTQIPATVPPTMPGSLLCIVSEELLLTFASGPPPIPDEVDEESLIPSRMLRIVVDVSLVVELLDEAEVTTEDVEGIDVVDGVEEVLAGTGVDVVVTGSIGLASKIKCPIYIVD